MQKKKKKQIAQNKLNELKNNIEIQLILHSRLKPSCDRTPKFGFFWRVNMLLACYFNILCHNGEKTIDRPKYIV